VKPTRFIVAIALAALGAVTTGCAATPEASSEVIAGTGAYLLKADMRKLWTEHVVWMRAYIVAAAADASDLQTATDRLMKNQEDIGQAVAGYYGKNAGDKLTALLKDHISTAAGFVNAAKSGDKLALKTADDAWHSNAMDIATFLSKTDPDNWPRATIASLMNEHLQTTTDEVTARLQKNWNADRDAYDRVYSHILKLSDAIADGIVKHFPEKFGS
jgi:hypothetical protein